MTEKEKATGADVTETTARGLGEVNQKTTRLQHEAAEALRESEQHLKIALQTAKLGSWQHDLVTGILSCSEQCKANFGLPPDAEFSHETLFAALHPEDLDRVQTAIQRAIEEHSDYEVEERCFWPDGSLHWLIARGRLVYDSDGTPIRMVGVTLDITDRKQFEESLKAANQRISNILASITDAFVTFDRQWRYSYVNQEAARLFQRSPEELLGKRWQDVFPEAAQTNAFVAQELERAVAEQVTVQFEVFSVAANRWLEVSGFPLPDGLAIYFRDISERKRQEQRKAARYAVTRVLAEATTLVDAVPAILQSLCESLGWQLGVIWSMDRHKNILHYVNSWQASSVNVQQFIKASQQATFAIGVGLPGRIWQSRQPIWIAELSEDTNFSRAASAAREGLQAAFGFPIQLGDEILGVIECFSDRLQEPDEDLLEMMAAIGSQIGQFMERKRTEEALRESQELFQSFMNNSPVRAYIKDEAGRYIYINRCIEQLFHYTVADWFGKTDFELFPAAIAAQWRENDLTVLATDQLLQKLEIEPVDGGRYLMSFKFPFQDASGRRLLAGMSLDVTEQIRAQEALETNLAQLEAVLHSMTDGLVIADPQGNILRINSAALALHEFQSIEDLPEHLPDIANIFEAWELDGQPIPFPDWPISRAIAGETFSGRRIHVRRIDTGRRWVAQYGSTPVRNKAGEVILMIVTITDITAQFTAEAALLRSQQELTDFVENASVGMHWVGADGTILWANQCDLDLLGYSREEYIGHHIAEFHADKEAIDDILQRLNYKETLCGYEARLRHKDGSIRYVSINSNVFWEDGKFVHTRCFAQDITDRKRVEEVLREREQRFSTLFNGMDDWVLVYHLTPDHRPGQFIEVNEQACKKLGYSREELLTMSVADVIGSPSINPKANVEKLLLEKHIVVESIHTTKDGRLIPVEVNATLFTLNGLPTVQSICRDITQRKQTEEALRNSEHLYRAIGETIDYGIWVCEPNGRNIYVSESLLRLVGLTQEQCSEFGWGDVLHPDDASASIAAWKECVRSGDLWDIEHRFRGVDGNWHPILARGVPVRDENGEIICWAGINLDISRLKRVEMQLRESEERFRTLANSAPVLFWVNDADGGCEFVNDSYLEFFGKSLKEVTGFGWRVQVHPDDEEPYLSAYLAALRERKPFRAQVRVKRADGQYRWLDSCALPRFSPTGEFMGYIGASPDITDIKQAQEALRQSEERFRLATRAVAGVVYDWDLETGRVYRSEGLYKLLGVRPEDAPETREWWTERIHPDDLACLHSVGNSILTGSDDRYEAEYRVRHEDGRWIDVWDCSYLIRDGNGQIIRIVGSSTDISDRKRASSEREQLLERERAAREEAEAANRIKDEFLAVLSHELRTPLNPILGWTRLLRTRKFDEQATDRALETIERNAKLQTQLIEDLLDVSRILQGKIALNVCPVNLVSTIEAAIETVRLAAQAKKIQIQTQLNCDVEPISGDPSRLQQIVWNLVSNAVKFTPAGGRVEVRLEQLDSYAQIQVKDTGKGISPEFLPHVFEYFRQADSTITRTFGGLGLGLAIVRHLTELHGGSVQAQSLGEGQGATFTVLIPRMVKFVNTPSNNQPSTTTIDLRGLRVLVVDDEADMRDLVVVILSEYGANVRVAASAAEALLLLDQFKPQVLVSDIGMPEVDGYTLMRQIRTRPPHQSGQISAIALTAYAGEVNQQQALAAGFQRHVPKPVEPEELARAIADLAKQTEDQAKP